jgi:hypothetical protein
MIAGFVFAPTDETFDDNVREMNERIQEEY